MKREADLKFVLFLKLLLLTLFNIINVFFLLSLFLTSPRNSIQLYTNWKKNNFEEVMDLIIPRLKDIIRSASDPVIGDLNFPQNSMF